MSEYRIIHVFIDIVVKQNIVLDIFRDVEIAKSIVWRKGASEEDSLTGTIQFLNSSL